ncbi:MAG: RNA-binding protein [Tannerellaceae bacterium]|nr:RNA-binding protein [Tannerellaceae bacterium]
MNIYIGNLHYGVRENDLKEIMEEYGVVNSTKLITDRETGRSKGFAFVEMENENEAGNAINALNGAELEGRTMVVKESTPRAKY